MTRWFDGTPGRSTLTITSVDRGDGKSFVCANLGVVFSQIGERTLIDISHEALIRCWSRIAAPTGWLAAEFQDGLKWRALLVQADDFAGDPEHLLALAAAEDHQRWLARHSAAWAERFGGGWDRVRALLDLGVQPRTINGERDPAGDVFYECEIVRAVGAPARDPGDGDGADRALTSAEWNADQGARFDAAEEATRLLAV